MAWLPDSENNSKFEDIFIRFGATHERDRQTDRQTDGRRMTAIAALMHRRDAQTERATARHATRRVGCGRGIIECN